MKMHKMNVRKTIRQKVSQDRVRFKDGNRNLDLTYITDNIIAMAFPAASFIEKTWRNSVNQVLSHLTETHGNNWMVWNLSEREYNTARLENRIIEIPFSDHHPPPLTQLCHIVNQIHNWVSASDDQIAVVHCIGGKGRTGTIISSLLFYSDICYCAEDALDFFGKARSKEERGVTQPSQRRFVHYFEKVVLSQSLNPYPLILVSVAINALPMSKNYGLEVYTSPYNGDLIYENYPEYKRANRTQKLLFNIELAVHKDLYIKVRKKKKKGGYSEKFHIVLHTYFITQGIMFFPKPDLDLLEFDREFPEELSVKLTFASQENMQVIDIEPEIDIMRINYVQRTNKPQPSFTCSELHMPTWSIANGLSRSTGLPIRNLPPLPNNDRSKSEHYPPPVPTRNYPGSSDPNTPTSRNYEGSPRSYPISNTPNSPTSRYNSGSSRPNSPFSRNYEGEGVGGHHSPGPGRNKRVGMLIESFESIQKGGT
eukprot:TRINITY_DN1994_c0_g1_i1.p1 TRINITY_DN1994_c0_g1~~TRINITY_DN1994_c0_g1_i1.p1  ORF type:complete len:492 (+),score=47.51 TRINITY_DN1994_c0_g1_i1:36-1478(+)